MLKSLSKTGIGAYLADANSKALYYFARDLIGTSNASGAILQTWPVFFAQNIVAPSPLNASDFGTITRSDGSMQTTFKGWPLYHYAGDQVLGDTKGDGIGGVWFLIKVPFYAVLLQSKSGIGNYLSDTKGMTLYWTTLDSAGVSNVTGATLANWPAFYAPDISVPSALSVASFGTIARSDGSMQTTYHGWPLYHYSVDKTSGDTNGQGVGGVWFAVNPEAQSPAPPPSPTVSITSPTNGAILSAGNITVNIQVANFNIVDKQGQANVPGEGHVHYYLDVDAPTTPGQPAIPASGVWAHVSAATYTFTNVTAGTHTISVELVNNDHTPLVPPAVAKVAINAIVFSGSGGGGGGSGGY